MFISSDAIRVALLLMTVLYFFKGGICDLIAIVLFKTLELDFVKPISTSATFSCQIKRYIVAYFEGACSVLGCVKEFTDEMNNFGILHVCSFQLV